MKFKQWLENEYQTLFPFASEEEPLSPDQIKKISKYKSKENYVKANSRGGKQTEIAAKKVAGSFINGYLGKEKIEAIYTNQVVIPKKEFVSLIKPERYIAFVKLVTENADNTLHRLLALYQGEKKDRLDPQAVLENEYQIIGSIVFQRGYITHVWVDPEYKDVNLYGKMREFVRKYYGIHGAAPGDDLLSKSYKSAEAKHIYNKFLSQSNPS